MNKFIPFLVIIILFAFVLPTVKENNSSKTVKQSETIAMENICYVCEICGYIYDPAEGDSYGEITPGTSFEDLPDDWVCPWCWAGKECFKKKE